MSILNYFKKVDQNKLTPKSENASDGSVLSAKKATEEKAKKKLALSDAKENQNDVEMGEEDLKSSVKKHKAPANDLYEDESDDIKPPSSKLATRLSEAGRDSPKMSKRKRIMVIDSDSDSASDENGE